MSRLFSLARPVLHAFSPETAHDLTIATLSSGLLTAGAVPDDPRLQVNCMGLDFPNPLGLAAGFDKNAEVPDDMLRLGFGFVEIGSVTPRPQKGNEKPRLFRLPEDKAVINRMGFNNDGHPRVFGRLADRGDRGGIVGVNLGANKDSEDRIADYALGAAVFNKLASYITVNVSSPNTPGLRALQSKGELETLIGRVRDAIDASADEDGCRAPLALKIAPDLVEEELKDIAAVCLKMKVDAVIVSNTTISRPPLKSKHKDEAGGLSGTPLFRLSTVQLARMHSMTKGKVALIGAGGIASAEDAWQKLRAGASLLQLYSALVYQGPQLVADILQGLIDRMEEHGVSRLPEVTGSGRDEWLKGGPPQE
ncbi:quinone-dependent dihydroorotate dehydrogenase [Anderseniella sp. Alg231-50]|uniref:quinone-dependent dihydroorotate dehydrogenase n=1 Tax=Anderseniella sp. Alg231-50 TaxID=1922226 RepID=UPI000D54D39C